MKNALIRMMALPVFGYALLCPSVLAKPRAIKIEGGLISFEIYPGEVALVGLVRLGESLPLVGPGAGKQFPDDIQYHQSKLLVEIQSPEESKQKGNWTYFWGVEDRHGSHLTGRRSKSNPTETRKKLKTEKIKPGIRGLDAYRSVAREVDDDSEYMEVYIAESIDIIKTNTKLNAFKGFRWDDFDHGTYNRKAPKTDH